MKLRASEVKLIEAVNSIINEDGFSKLGINQIAREAGCDKVLIYRYFGGLEGLITAWAKKYDFYIQAYDSFEEKIELINEKSLKEIAKEILTTQLHFTRQNKTHQKLLLWELSGNLKFKVIRELREQNGYRLQKMLNEKIGIKNDEVNIYITVLIASINYTVLSTLSYPKFNGINFSNDQSWIAYENALCDYIDMLFDKMKL